MNDSSFRLQRAMVWYIAGFIEFALGFKWLKVVILASRVNVRLKCTVDIRVIMGP